MTNGQEQLPHYFELRRRAIAMVDSVSQTTCRYCAEPCCERRLCMDAYHKFETILDFEPKADAIRKAAANEASPRPFIDRQGCMYSVLRPTVCLSFFCDEGLMGLLRTQQLCVLAMGRAFPDKEIARSRDLQFLEYALDVCEGVLLNGESLQEKDKRRLVDRIPGLNNRLKLYVMGGGRKRLTDVDNV